MTQLKMTWSIWKISGACTTDLIQVKTMYESNTENKFKIQISDFQSIEQEEWLGFRGKAYKKTMDFIIKWQDKLKDTPVSPLTIKIHTELEAIRVIYHKMHYQICIFVIICWF